MSLPRILVGLISLILIAGCAEKPVGVNAELTPDQIAISETINLLKDARSPKKFKELFVGGKAPAKISKFQEKFIDIFDAAAAIQVNGNTANVEVMLIDSVADTETPKQWVFEKEGEAWKIKSAPL